MALITRRQALYNPRVSHHDFSSNMPNNAARSDNERDNKRDNAKAPRRLVVCCDGTGNEIKQDQSNVLKFYHMMKHDDQQICFYDVGVGAIASSGDWSDVFVKTKNVFSLATGWGLNKNVIEAYQFLLRNYQVGDEIFLFGFSRGAYTVRALAAFIHMIGLLDPQQEHLAAYAFRAYQKVGIKGDKDIAYRVNKALRTRRPSITMLGCWDTVGSVFIPNPKYCYCPTRQPLPFISDNPSVKKFRHAMAIDEKRRMYRLVPWQDEQRFNKIVYQDNGPYVAQDVDQRWFAGVHSDIGGGYPEQESQLAKFPLIWMMQEAENSGIQFRQRMVNMMAHGQDNYPGHEKRAYVAPDHRAAAHDSMLLRWQWLEYLPAIAKGAYGRQRKTLLGLYIPNKESRDLGASPKLHESVEQRLADACAYQPVNLAAD